MSAETPRKNKTKRKTDLFEHVIKIHEVGRNPPGEAEQTLRGGGKKRATKKERNLFNSHSAFKASNRRLTRKGRVRTSRFKNQGLYRVTSEKKNY